MIRAVGRSASPNRGKEAPGFSRGEELPPSVLYVIFVCDIIVRMETTRTIVLKLRPTPEQATEMDATLSAFAEACDYIADIARRIHSTNKVLVQKECYKDVRERFGLSANLTIRAIARACAALKVPEKAHSAFKPTSVDYDARIFSFREWDWTVSLMLLFSRSRIETAPGERQKRSLRGAKPTSAFLVKRDGRYFLHIQIDGEVPDPIDPDDFLGVDLGIADIATDSDGETHSGADVDKVRKKHNLQRKRLGKKNTKGSKKKIRRMRDKEARFRRHQNHVISKKLVESAKDTGRGIACEDLKGIRGRITARGGDARNRLSGWSFGQLCSFVAYKAQSAGVPVVYVDPRYTSRTCAECGHCERSNRKSQSEFKCKACGHKAHADVNAARNIRALATRKMATELGNQPGDRVA
jgi:IS605 OrfB family transposase